MSARDSYQESGRFPSTRNGNANRRANDVEPRVLVLDVSPDNRGARLHFAGDENIRMAWISDLGRDADTLKGMDPLDAFRVGKASHG